MPHRRGAYISLDGPDGCGKSTQAAKLAAYREAVLTREPGGTATGYLIRGILLDPAHIHMKPEVDVLLLSADRRQHIAEVIGPTIISGRDVVSDRSFYSTYLYQGYGSGVPKDFIDKATELAVGVTRPDIPIFIDVDYETRVKRIGSGDDDRYEGRGREFHDRIRNGLYKLAHELGDKAILLDGTGGVDDVANELRERVQEKADHLDLEQPIV